MSAPGAGGETPLFPVASVRWGRCSRRGGINPKDGAFPKYSAQLRSCPGPSPLGRSSGIFRHRNSTRRYRHSLSRRRIAAVQHRHWPLQTTGCRLCTHSCGSRGSGASSTWRSAAARETAAAADKAAAAAAAARAAAADRAAAAWARAAAVRGSAAAAAATAAAAKVAACCSAAHSPCSRCRTRRYFQ